MHRQICAAIPEDIRHRATHACLSHYTGARQRFLPENGILGHVREDIEFHRGLEHSDFQANYVYLVNDAHWGWLRIGFAHDDPFVSSSIVWS